MRAGQSVGHRFFFSRAKWPRNRHKYQRDTKQRCRSVERYVMKEAGVRPVLRRLSGLPPPRPALVTRFTVKPFYSGK